MINYGEQKMLTTVQMANLKSLISLIDDMDDIKEIAGAFNAKVKHLQRMSTYSFYKGMRVSFKSNKTGCTITGRVDRVNQKTLSITADDGTSWKVSATMVNKIK